MALSPQLKAARAQIWQLTSINGKVKNERNFTIVPTVCLDGMGRGNFTFILNWLQEYIC
jgi:hypothetical protein